MRGYDTDLGWEVVYDMEQGEALTKTRRVYIKDRAKLVAMIDDCLLYDKDEETFYERQKVLADLKGGKSGRVSEKEGNTWLVKFDDGTKTRMHRETLVQMRGNHLLKEKYRVSHLPDEIFTGTLHATNQLKCVPTGEQSDVRRGKPVSRVMKPDDPKRSGSDLAINQIAVELLEKIGKPGAIFSVGGKLFTIAPASSLGGDPVNGLMHQDSSYGSEENSGSEPRTYAILICVGEASPDSGGEVVLFLNSEWDEYEGTFSLTKNEKLIKMASFKYTAKRFRFSPGTYIVYDPNIYHYGGKYHGDVQRVLYNFSIVVDGEFNHEDNNGNLAPWMTEVKRWMPVIANCSAGAGLKTVGDYDNENDEDHDGGDGDDKDDEEKEWKAESEDEEYDDDCVDIRLSGSGGSRGMYWTLPWNKWHAELTKYKAKHGHLSVPKNQYLGEWVHRQRATHKKGKLSKDRVQKLDDIGFVWNPKSKHPTWNERHAELTEYKAEHGHCIVPQRQGTLGTWVSWQRKSYKKSKLSEERVQKLDALGFVWIPGTKRTQVTWDDRHAELTEYSSQESWNFVLLGE